ncbi:MAG: right-handed parallel beta-helix repeat-containing protein [Phycisphaerae bacterium]|nr:right-handed parallel beta-helix repeat-containing protein [Phycisphaerae bacterium]
MSNYGATLGQWQASTGQDVHSFSVDPRFADPAGGDYHLQAENGRYDPATGTWVLDGETSWAIDMGDTGSLFDQEPSPNGDRVNLGAYGGTAQASKSLLGRRLLVLNPNGDEVISDTYRVNWLYQGAAWQASDTLALEYSSDAGGSWDAMLGGAVVNVTDRMFDWDTTLAVPDSGFRFLCRATSNADPLVSDAGDGMFMLHNQPLSYYVNDAATTNDVYSTAPGDDANDGGSPATPKASLASLLTDRNLEPGDIVYVDTGYYPLSSTLVVDLSDEGDALLPVTFRGSTHPDGTTMDLQGLSGDVIRCTASYAVLEQLRLTGASEGAGFALRSGKHTTIRDSRLYGNEYGVHVQSGPDDTTIRNCVIFDNTSAGIYSYSTAATRILNNTIVATNANGLKLDGRTSGVTVRNNIIQVSGAESYAFSTYRMDNPFASSDYNNLQVVGGAAVGDFKETVQPTLSDWRTMTGFDSYSLSADSLFANPAGGDYHLKSAGGRYDPVTGTWVADAETSWAIDAGDPGDAVGSEPSPNGARVNMGAYGATDEASRTPTGRRLLALTPNGGETVSGSQPVMWLHQGTGWLAGDTVDLEYSSDAGANWSAIAGGTGVNASDETFSWDTSGAIPDHGARFLWRVTGTADGEVSDAGDGTFTVHNQPVAYYVNDGSTTNDVYTTAMGDDANDGGSPATPKASLASLLTARDLEPGDVVYVDTGYYPLSSTLIVDLPDEGDALLPVTLRGSTHADGTTLDLQGNDGDVIKSEASYVVVEHMILTGATSGAGFAPSDDHNNGYGAHTTIRNSRLFGNKYGVHLNWGPDFSTIQNCVIYGNTTAGVYAYSMGTSATNTQILNNTIVADIADAVHLDSRTSSTTLRGNIIQVSGLECYAIYCESLSIVSSDYNNIHLTNLASAVYYTGGYAYDEDPATYHTLADWQFNRQDLHSIDSDPMFADPMGHDYHLKSSGGRYEPVSGNWAIDAETSWAVDAADVALGVGDEPSPHGDRMNMGAYGGTDQASRSPAGRRLLVLNPNGGQTIAGTRKLIWLHQGTDWAASETVLLEYSPDTGASWNTMTGGAAVDVSLGEFDWDTTQVAPDYGTDFLWRVTSNVDLLVSDSSDDEFTVWEFQAFFVNDASTTNDQWCIMPGDDANNGLTPATPKATVQSLLSTYDLEPGDVVLVDTGRYEISSNIEIGPNDQGSSLGHVTFRGSPHPDGTTIDGSGFYVSGEDYLRFEELRITNAGVGINMRMWGGNRSEFNEIRNCVFYGNQTGIRNEASQVVISNCTLVANTSRAIYAWGSSSSIIKNNIIWADGAGVTAFYMSDGEPSSDYNNIYLTNGAQMGFHGHSGSYTTFESWQAGTHKDAHSISLDPLFGDPANHDYRLKSTAEGDAGTSPSIDAGDPSDLVGDEPTPNGGRINQGAYGGTARAARTPAIRTLFVLYPNGGDTLSGTKTVNWSQLGSDWQTGDQVKLEYSTTGDTGPWTQIPGAESLDYDAGTFDWDTSGVLDTLTGQLRISRVGDETVYDISDRNFAVRNHGTVFSFYVNDTNTLNDVYCTSPGDDANDGLTPATPRATVQAILADYDLNPGDLVLIDTGIYVLSSDVLVTDADQGSSSSDVTFRGSSHSDGTTIDRQDTESGAECFYVSGDYVRLENLRLTGAYYGAQFNRSTGSSLVNSVMYGNKTGVREYDGTGTSIVNCTITENTTRAIDFYSALNVTVKNNLLWAKGPNADVTSTTHAILWDYNNLYATEGASISGNYATLVEWQAATGYDRHSLSADPLFRDAASRDYRLKSTAEGDAETSVCIDAGDPGDPLADEPIPNGGRINLGAFGGTLLAARTPAARHLFVVQPNDNETLTGAIPIRWHNVGTEWQAGDTVKIEYSVDGQAGPWTQIPGAESLDYTAAAFDWDTTAVSDTLNCYLKLTWTADDIVTDMSDVNFFIRNTGTPFTLYVNDDQTANDVYCTAVGDDANDGLTPATPKATVQAILSRYDLEPGDLVLIDTGIYDISSAIEVEGPDGGSASSSVTLRGSTHPAGTRIDRGGYVEQNTSLGWTMGFKISADYIRLERLYLTGAYYGVHVYNKDGVDVVNCIVSGNEHGIYLSNADNGSIVNCTIAYNTRPGIYAYYPSGLTVKNNVVFASGWGASAISLRGSGITSDYNNLYATGGAHLGKYNYGDALQTLADWQAETGQDAHSVSLDPLFRNPAGFDYRLKSTVDGHTQTSISIDAGDPGDPVGDESTPNGARVNQGAFGGTTLAARTPDRALVVLNPNGGENLTGVVPIGWHTLGVDWQADDDVKLEYSTSSDAGPWTQIVGAESLDYDAGTFDWDTAPLADTPTVRVRVTWTGDPGVNDVSDRNAILRNQGSSFTFYVNDSSTVDDMYCTAAGDTANDGVTPATPKASVQAVVGGCDLEPGDVVLIDTGNYVLSADVRLEQEDAGSEAEDVTFRGSTRGYGTTLDRNTAGAIGNCFYVNASNINLENLRLTGALRGVYLYQQSDVDLVNCLAYGNKYGINVSSGSNHSIVNNTIVGNTYGLIMYNPENTTVKNNIIWAQESGGYAIHRTGTGVMSDYNDLYATNGAEVGQDQPTLADWQAATVGDVNSVSADPLFANSAGGDYHLKSAGGRYDPVTDTWVLDAETSWAVDAGDPDYPVGDEPKANGGRINMGAYGGTPLASKSLLAGRHIFYNNSAWDGNDPAANTADDAAIASDKAALLPGRTPGAANYTSYWLGINGIMVDIDDPPGTPTDTDFGLRVNEAANPDTWSAGPAPAVTVRPGEGVGGSDRVTLIWADGEIRNRWVEVTVLATVNTGLAADDVFYFANLVGDCDADGEVGASDYGTLAGEFGLRGGVGALAADLNGDGRVGLTDFAIMRGAIGNSVSIPTFPAAAPEAVVESGLGDLAVTARVTSVNPGAASDPAGGGPSAVISNQLTANDPAAAIDLLGGPLSTGGYVAEPRTVMATRLQRAATSAYDLKPLRDDPAGDAAGDDLLADVLEEAVLSTISSQLTIDS